MGGGRPGRRSGAALPEPKSQGRFLNSWASSSARLLDLPALEAAGRTHPLNLTALTGERYGLPHSPPIAAAPPSTSRPAPADLRLWGILSAT